MKGKICPTCNFKNVQGACNCGSCGEDISAVAITEMEKIDHIEARPITAKTDELKELSTNDDYVKLLLSFEGRLNRKPYWIIHISYLFVNIILLTSLDILQNNEILTDLINFFVLILWAIGIWIGFAINVKRLHDMNRSGLWTLIVFLPPGPLIIILVCGFFRGTIGDNRFGSDPLIQHT